MFRILLLMVFLFSNACFAATDDIEISVMSNPKYRTSHGYYTYKILVTNTSRSQSHEVALQMPERTYGFETHIAALTKSIVVPPLTNIEVVMLQPAVQMSGNTMAVSIDGTKVDPVSFSPSDHGQSYRDVQPRVLVSQSANYDSILEKAASNMSTDNGPGKHSSSTESEIFNRSDVPVSQWDRSWLNYSCFDSVIVTSQDLTTMSPDVQRAIYEYVSAGGSLLVLGQYADAVLLKWPENSFFVADANVYRVGFGIVAVCPNEKISSWSDEFWNQVSNVCWEESVSPFVSLDDYESANSKFPIADISVPVRGLFTLVLIFAIVIGPVNILILSKWKKRIWLLWTVPAMSFVTCAVIFMYSMFAEGWTATSRTLSVTLLDQRDNRAATLGWQAFYSPLSPGDGLHYDLNTEITMLGIKRHSSETRACRIDLTNGQHLRSGFLKSRVPAHFMLRKCQFSRQRVVIESDDEGHLTASNGLGAPINKFYYVHSVGGKKQVYRAQNIGAGAKVILIDRIEVNDSETLANGLRDFYRGNWPLHAQDFSSPQNYIKNSGYIAYCEEPLFIEQGFKSAKPKQNQSIIIGITE